MSFPEYRLSFKTRLAWMQYPFSGVLYELSSLIISAELIVPHLPHDSLLHPLTNTSLDQLNCGHNNLNKRIVNCIPHIVDDYTHQWNQSSVNEKNMMYVKRKTQLSAIYIWVYRLQKYAPLCLGFPTSCSRYLACSHVIWIMTQNDTI